jgi:[protein-PII] uridylyltransferase
MKADAATRSTLLNRFKSRLQTGQKAIRESYLAKPDALRLLHERCRLIDEVLCDLWHELGFPAPLALLRWAAMGAASYFRHPTSTFCCSCRKRQTLR